MIRTLVIALALAIPSALAFPAFAQVASADPAGVRPGRYTLDKSHSKMNWGVSHFGFSTYTGEFADFTASLELNPTNPAQSRLDVQIAAASVETNDAALNKHLRSGDFLDVEKFPAATFRSTAVRRVSATEAKVDGTLTLRGTSKPVTLDVRFVGSGVNPVTKAYTVGFAASTMIRRTDFGISTFAPAIGEAVELRISGEFNPDTPAP